MAKISNTAVYPIVIPTVDDLLIGTNGADGKTKNFEVGAVVALAAFSVASVNGQTGVVVLLSADVGADASGTAASAIVAHEAASDPHPQYQTQTEGDARYWPLTTDLATQSELDTHAGLTTTAHGGIVASSDSRLSDVRVPTTHASTHAAAGSDPLTLAESQITGLVADLAAKAPAARTLTINGTALDLLADRSWTVGTVMSVGVNAPAAGITASGGPITSAGINK